MFKFDANKVNQIRIEQRYKVKDIAKTLGLSAVQTSAKLNGKADWRASEITKISKLFNVAPGEFFTEIKS